MNEFSKKFLEEIFKKFFVWAMNTSDIHRIFFNWIKEGISERMLGSVIGAVFA